MSDVNFPYFSVCRHEIRYDYCTDALKPSINQAIRLPFRNSSSIFLYIILTKYIHNMRS